MKCRNVSTSPQMKGLTKFKNKRSIYMFPMATHSSILAWKIPRTEEPGRLQSMESQRVGHNWMTSLSFFSSSFKKKKKIKGMINKDNLLRNDSWPLRQPRILTSWYSHLCITPLGVCLGLQDGSLWTRLAAMSWEPRHVATGDPPHIRLQLSLFCRTLLVSGKCSW